MEKFEIALMDLENCPAPMLVKWLDTFERYWVRHNQQVLHQLHLATGKVSDQWAQTGQVADTTYPPQGDATEHREEDPGAIIDVGMGVVSAELLAARGASEVFKNCLSNYQNQFLAKKTAAQSSEAIVEEPETREVGAQTTVNVAFPPSHNIGAASQNTPTALVQKSAKAFQEATLARWARLVLLLGKFNVQSFPPLPLATVNAMLASRRAKLEHGTHAELMEQQMLLEREEAELKQVQRDLEKAADDAKPSTVFGYLLGARRDEVSPSELSRPSEVHT